MMAIVSAYRRDRRLGAAAWCPGHAVLERVLEDIVIIPHLDELAPLDPVQGDAGSRVLFTRRFDVTDMLDHLVLSLVRAGRPPVREDDVPVRGDIHDLKPHVRPRLTRISDGLFRPLHPGVLRMQGRMIMEVISEVLMRNIEVAPHNFLESALMKPPDERLVFFDGHRRAPFLGNDVEISGVLANLYRLHPDVQMKSLP